MDVLLVKLGGSLITDKGGRQRARPGVLRRLARELAGHRGRSRILLGHGSGSFGHRAAETHGLDGTRSVRDPRAASAVQAAAHALHGRVMEALRGAAVSAISLPPSGWAAGACGRITAGSIRCVEAALRAGGVPVVCGDVLLDADGAATICSTERVMAWCARRLSSRGHRVRRAVWLGVTDGVYDGAGATVRELSPASWRALREDVGGAGAVDVTGGMRLRVETALDMARDGVEGWILDGSRPGRLARALGGAREGGTRVPPRRRT